MLSLVRISPRTNCKSTNKNWDLEIFSLKNLEFTKILPIFAASNRGIRRKDDNLYGLRVVSSPNHTSHHSSERWLCLFDLLRNCDAILHQIVIGTLKTDSQFNILVHHDQEFLKLLLISGVTFGRQFFYKRGILKDFRQMEYRQCRLVASGCLLVSLVDREELNADKLTKSLVEYLLIGMLCNPATIKRLTFDLSVLGRLHLGRSATKETLAQARMKIKFGILFCISLGLHYL